jgi:hypothetical protein
VLIRANMDELAPAQFERVVDALLNARGYAPRFAAHDADAEVLKAAGDSHDDNGDDFEFNYLRELWRIIEALFSGYIDRVLGDLDEMARAGTLSTPIDLARQQDREVRRVLQRRAAKVMAALGLPPLTEEQTAARVPWAVDLIEESYRLGLMHAEMRPEVSWTVATEVARKAPLTPADREAMAYMKARAGAYLRPNIDVVGDDVMQRLLARDREIVMRRTLTGIRAHIHPNRLAGYMADLTGTKVDRGNGTKVWSGGDWSRDWRRVARTEMADAYNHGHLQAALREHPVNDGVPAGEPLKVPKRLAYKITQKPRYDGQGRLLAPCKHCYRLWRADDKTPRLYPLDELVRNGSNAQGDDGKPRKAAEWVATIGPTHPNDLCGPVLFFNPLVGKQYPGFAAQLAAFTGQGFESVP